LGPNAWDFSAKKALTRVVALTATPMVTHLKKINDI
jgi:hypothetical protein